jgi:DNA repair photolyase
MGEKRLQVIYRPRGPAREYAELALNPYKGCTHRCVYCYNAKRMGANGVFFKSAQPRDFIVDKVEHDCMVLFKMYGDLCPEIHLTFLGDCYQPAEIDLNITRSIIMLLIAYELPFTILTKSPYILRDIDLLGPYKKFRAGFSFTTVNQADASAWEPGLPDVSSRISTLRQFANFGKPTWISLEPVMKIESTIEVIKELKALPDFYWIGALNHHKPLIPINIVEARNRIGAALKNYGCTYKFKNSFNFTLG